MCGQSVITSLNHSLSFWTVTGYSRHELKIQQAGREELLLTSNTILSWLSTEKLGQTEPSSTISLPKRPLPHQGQAGPKQELGTAGFLCGWQGPSCLSRHYCLPECALLWHQTGLRALSCSLFSLINLISIVLLHVCSVPLPATT